MVLIFGCGCCQVVFPSACFAIGGGGRGSCIWSSANKVTKTTDAGGENVPQFTVDVVPLLTLLVILRKHIGWIPFRRLPLHGLPMNNGIPSFWLDLQIHGFIAHLNNFTYTRTSAVIGTLVPC